MRAHKCLYARARASVMCVCVLYVCACVHMCVCARVCVHVCVCVCMCVCVHVCACSVCMQCVHVCVYAKQSMVQSSLEPKKDTTPHRIASNKSQGEPWIIIAGNFLTLTVTLIPVLVGRSSDKVEMAGAICIYITWKCFNKNTR
jgi:hypothetical protein